MLFLPELPCRLALLLLLLVVLLIAGEARRSSAIIVVREGLEVWCSSLVVSIL